MKTKKNVLLGMALVMSLVYICWGGITNYTLVRRSTQIFTIWFVSYLVNISTVHFQAMSNNRILTPSLLGYDRLYMLIQIIVTVVLKQTLSNTYLYIITVILLVVFSSLLYTMILKVTHHNVYLLLLIGMIISTFISSLSSTLQMMMDPNEFSMIQNQSLASFNGIHTNSLVIGVILSSFGFIVYRKLRNAVDVVALGRHHAMNLGVNVDRYEKLTLVMIGIFTAITTALVGPITFLGLLCVNLAREWFSDYRASSIITGSTLLGVILLIASQLLFERILSFNGSISIVINVMGGLVFMGLLLKERRQ